MPQAGEATQITLPESTLPEPPSKPFLLQNPGLPVEAVVTTSAAAPAPRLPRIDPFEVRLSGKLLRAQLRGTLPARIR